LNNFSSLAKFRDLSLLPPAKSVLYLDCDTFLFDDVEKLFETYCSGADIYYREEVMTRRSHYGYFPAWIDEDQLAAIAEQNHVRLMIPCNTGVVLMHNQMWLRIDYELFIEFAWRLLVGASMKIDIRLEPDLAGVRDQAQEHDRRDAICYPARSG
jgi:lipopolysaccharide biosynthesis glycosyltransferase